MKTVQFISQLIIPLFILLAVGYGWVKKVRVYDSFVAGAKDGISVVIKIFPYLLAIFVAVKGFQASGAFDFSRDLFRGSAETTFYILAVYLGAVGIKKTRYLVPVCLLADVVGILIAISVVRILFR
jgi:spore maturation protein B